LSASFFEAASSRAIADSESKTALMLNGLSSTA
jgi:hypothetical protein